MIVLIAEAALRSLALGAVVWLALRIFPSRNPHLQKTVWLTVLVASIVMPFVLAWRVAPTFEAPSYLITLGEGAAAPNAAVPGALTSLKTLLQSGAITIAWLLVTLALVARFGFGLLRIWRIRRHAVPMASACVGPFDVRVTPKVLSPATFGSTILLPVEAHEWGEGKLAAVLSHERSHVRHYDCYVQWLARLHACIFWFNPLAWWLNRRLAELAETTSDDAVIQTTTDRTAYADLLLEIARKPAPGRLVMSAARPNISARIERIISDIPPALPPRRWVRWAAVAVLIVPITMAAATLRAPTALKATPAATPAPKAASAPQLKLIDTGPGSEKFYPAAAKRAGIKGVVTLALTVDRNGTVTDTRIVDMTPNDVDWGFGPAASEVGRTLQFSNPTGRTASTNIRVKFELKDRPVKTPDPASPVPGATSPAPPAPDYPFRK
jgi:TonB family protein